MIITINCDEIVKQTLEFAKSLKDKKFHFPKFNNNNNDNDASTSPSSSPTSPPPTSPLPKSSLPKSSSSSLLASSTLAKFKESMSKKRQRLAQEGTMKSLKILMLVTFLGSFVHFVVHLQFITNQRRPQEIKQKSRMIHFAHHQDEELLILPNHFDQKKSRTIPSIKQSQLLVDEQDQSDREEDCVAQYDWQLESYPTCNMLHEYDMTQFSLSKSKRNKSRLYNWNYNYKKNSDNNINDFDSEEDHEDISVLKLLSHGYFRDVWRHKTLKTSFFVKKSSEQQLKNNNHRQDYDDDDDELFDIVAIKTLRYDHEFLPEFYERSRRDAVASERLTKYDSIMDIYGYCGQTTLFEYADGGTLEQVIGKSSDPFTPKEKLIVGYQLVQAFYALHNVDKIGKASIAHTDAMAKQFLYVSKEQRFKLNDFNSAEFIMWNKYSHLVCPFEITNNAGRYRSPEEYKYSHATEKADMYALGNLFYMLLTSAIPFYDDLNDENVIERIKNGETPGLLWEEDDFLAPLYRAANRCFDHDPKRRISSFQLKQDFETAFRFVGVPLSLAKVRHHEIPKEHQDVQYHEARRLRRRRLLLEVLPYNETTTKT